MDSRITYNIAVTIFKCLRDLAPSYLVEILTIHQRDSRYRQVDTLQLRQPVAKKSVGQQAFSVTGPRVWNALPTELRYALSLASLSVKLNHFYSQNTTLYNTFYSKTLF